MTPRYFVPGQQLKQAIQPIRAAKEMLTLDQIRSARWGEMYLFLTTGNPPLLLILLGINTLFFILYLVRRATKRNRLRASTVYFVQAAVVVANAIVLVGDEAVRFVMTMRNII